jgi:undecaprenyl-diphosphatase
MSPHSAIATIENVLGQLGPLAPWLVFLVIALESSAFLGLFFPGEAVALIAGALAGAGVFSLRAAFCAAIAGAIIGDLLGYYLGRYWGTAVLARWSFARRQYEKHRARLESYFERWGPVAIILGRFVAIGRIFVPFAAGLLKMRARRFVPMAIIAGVAWGGVTIALGYLLGSNWIIVEKIARSLGVGIIALLLLTFLMATMWRLIVRRETEISGAWERHIGQPYGARLAPVLDFIRDRFSPRGYLGLHLTVGLIIVAALGWLFGGIVDVISEQGGLVDLSVIVASFINSHRTFRLDAVMSAIAVLGSLPWLILIVAAGALLSERVGDSALAFATIPVLLGAYVLGLVLQTRFARMTTHYPSPNAVGSFAGFPDVTMTASTAAYGMICYIVVSHVTDWRIRTLTVVLAFYVVSLIGIADLYWGQPLSAIIGGFALGGSWLTICLTGIRTYDRLRSAPNA